MSISLSGRTILVTGANGGLGTAFVEIALQRGAAKVYAAARSPKSWNDERVEFLSLDVTDPAAVEQAVAVATDVDLVINNAGSAPAGDSLNGPEADLRAVFETNFFGPLRVANAFAPTLAANGGGAILNVLSAAAWLNLPTTYAASKAALWSATNGLRAQLAGQGTQVTALLMGMVDTPMSARWDVPKVSPESVVQQAYDGLADGALEVLADDDTRGLKSMLSTPAEELYPRLDALVAGFVA